MSLENDPRFQQGVAMAEAKRFEDAAEHFAELLDVRVQLAGDEMDASLAPLYLEYGSSLLSKVEEARSMLGDVLLQRAAKAAASAEGDGSGGGGGASSAAPDDAAGAEIAAGMPSATATANREAGSAPGASADAYAAANAPPAAAAATTAAIGEDQGSAAEQSRAAEQNEGQQDDGEPEEEPEDPLEAAQKQEEQDLEIAWEILDVARVLYSKLNEQGDFAARKPLSRAHLRLGDLNMLNGQYAQAVEEFTRCLELRRSFLPPFSRPLADVQNELYNAHLYLASATEKEAERAAVLATAKTHLLQAAEILEGMAQELRQKIASREGKAGASAATTAAATPPAAAAAPATVNDATNKTDEELLAELEDLAETLREGLEAPEASLERGETSIGFGAAAAATGAADVLPGDAAAGGAAAAPAAPVAKPQVKRKAKPAAAAAMETAERSDAKRPKER